MTESRTLAQAASFYLILPSVAVLIGLTLFLRHKQITRSGLMRRERYLLCFLLLLYLLTYLYLTFFYRTPASEPRIELHPFWSYREALRYQEASLGIERLGVARQIVLNILVYIPIGLLLPLAFCSRKHPYVLTLAAGALLSAVTETLQYITRRGLCELDDLMDNTLGCLIGIALMAAGTAILRCRQRRQSLCCIRHKNS